MAEIPKPDRLRRGIALSKLLVFLNSCVMGFVIWDCILLFQGFFPIQGDYELAVEAFQGRVWQAYGLTWFNVAFMAIDLAITIFRHEYFHGGTLSLKGIWEPANTTSRNLVYHGIAAGINLVVLISWIAYFAHGPGLFHGEIIFGTITITPAEYVAYFLINGIFAISTLVFTFFLISTRWLTAKRFQREFLPHPILAGPEPQAPEQGPGVITLDDMRVPPVVMPPSEPTYIPIEERKAQKLEELRIRRENVFEDEKSKLTRELEEKKHELLERKQKEQDNKMRRSKEYQKIKQDIIFKMNQKAASQKPAEKPPAKKRDQFDFT